MLDVFVYYISFQDVMLNGASVAPTSQVRVCHLVLPIVKKNKKYEVGVVFNGIKIPKLIKIRPAVPDFKNVDK